MFDISGRLKSKLGFCGSGSRKERQEKIKDANYFSRKGPQRKIAKKRQRNLESVS